MNKWLKARRGLHLILGVGLSGLFLYLALRGEDWSAIWDSLSGARVGWLVPMVPFGVYVLLVRSQRWRFLLVQAAGRPVPLGTVFSANAIGFMANMVLPFRVGEVARPYLVTRNTDVPLSVTLATVVMERVLDLFALFCFAVFVVITAETPPLVKNLTAVIGVMALGGAAVAWILAAQRERFQPLLDAVLGVFPERFGSMLSRIVDDFLTGMSALGSLSVVAIAVSSSLYIWLLVAIGFAFGFPALGLDLPFLSGGVTVATLVALAVALPGAPGFVGQFEYGCKLALEGVMGMQGAATVGYALVVHTTQFLTQVLLGLVYLAKEGLSFADLGQMEEQSVAAQSD